jgi:catechol 2,3-dioxygenase-like lactoylglutathione lyase family enzyme
MIDHVTLQVADVGVSAAFYTAVLEPLGLFPDATDGAVGFGNDEGFCFWLCPAERPDDRELHVAFHADSRQAVVAFHRAAVDQGAPVLNQPGLFTQYDPDYFATFIRDPDGHNIEAVCRDRPSEPTAPAIQTDH